jgi:hypothetical protein
MPLIAIIGAAGAKAAAAAAAAPALAATTAAAAPVVTSAAAPLLMAAPAATTAATTAATAAAAPTVANLGTTAALEASKQGIIQAGAQQAGVEAAKSAGVEVAKQAVNPGITNSAGQLTSSYAAPSSAPPMGISTGTPSALPPAVPEATSAYTAPSSAPPMGISPGTPPPATPTLGTPGNPIDPNANLLKGVDYAEMPGVDIAHAGSEAASTGLQKGFESAMKFAKDNPLATTLGMQAVGTLLAPKPSSGGPPKKQYARSNMSQFQASEPSTIEYNPIYQPTPYAEGGITYGIGGAVEQMSAQNALSSNQMYPQSQLQTAMYSNPMAQRPIQNNVINAGIDTPVDPYSGEQRYAKGGTTVSSDASKRYAQMMGIRSAEQQRADEEYLDAYAKRESAKSINTDADVDTRLKDPLNASLTSLKKIGKRVGIKPVDLPKSNVTDSNVFHAAANGGAVGYAKGGSSKGGSSNTVSPEMIKRLETFGIAGIGGMGRAELPPWIEEYFDKYPTYAANGGIMYGLGGYSDGGRLLKGPGDGVSDSIPATIGNRQPARLADGEFVVPARIVSELGNGSTEAGARKLYQMMERVQADRKKSIGKGKVAVNSKATKHLPK